LELEFQWVFRNDRSLTLQCSLKSYYHIGILYPQMSKRDEQNEFDNIVLDFCKRKLDYSYSELQRIKDRSHQIVVFFLIIISIVSASLTTTFLDKILQNNLILGILITGFWVTILTMILSFKIMIGRHKNFVVDPKKLNELCRELPINETKEVLRDSMFEKSDLMDERNDKLHDKMFKIYELSIISLVIIFIPMIWLIFNR